MTVYVPGGVFLSLAVRNDTVFVPRDVPVSVGRATVQKRGGFIATALASLQYLYVPVARHSSYSR